MGEFHDAVNVLLDAFARGVSVIKCKKEHIPQDSTQKVADRHLSKSLKKSRTDVKKAYSRDLARSGPGFAAGDAEAHSSISSILFRLNAGFVSVIERFTKGRSTQTDYAALMNLSDASRLEAIQTFSQLSQRLSRSSLALVPAQKQHTHSHRRKHSKPSAELENLKHSRSKSAPSLPVNAAGWVRPKPHRKLSSESRSSGSRSPSKAPPQRAPQTSLQPRRTPPPPYSKPSDKRKSIMSFASDSTKLGEIPEHKWARPPLVGAGGYSGPVYYPLEPYQLPEKRSRLRKLFGRS